MPKLTVQAFDPRPNVLLSTEYEAQRVAQNVASSDIPVETVNLRVGQPWEYGYAVPDVYYKGYLLDLIIGTRILSSVNCGLLYVQLRDLPNAKWQLTEAGDLVRH